MIGIRKVAVGGTICCQRNSEDTNTSGWGAGEGLKGIPTGGPNGNPVSVVGTVVVAVGIAVGNAVEVAVAVEVGVEVGVTVQFGPKMVLESSVTVPAACARTRPFRLARSARQ